MTTPCASDGRVRRMFDDEIVKTFHRLGPCARAIARDMEARGMTVSPGLILRRLKERRLWPWPAPSYVPTSQRQPAGNQGGIVTEG